MQVSDVSKLPPLERFLYWIKERHQIFLKRRAGQPPPWTDDSILQTCFFTNPFRENDRTTVWFRNQIRDPRMDHYPDSFFTTVAFRWFNYIPTGQLMVKNGLTTPDQPWNNTIKEALHERAKTDKVFTGAFMITIPCPKGGKVTAVCNALDAIYKQRQPLAARLMQGRSLRNAHKVICSIKGIGGFMGYEMVSDLRHTCVLNNATDIESWCHMGPGASYGYLRLLGKVTGLVEPTREKGTKRVMRPEAPALPAGYMTHLYELMTTVRSRLRMPSFEMRDVEHSLCEFDKYERYRLGAPARRKYSATGV